MRDSSILVSILVLAFVFGSTVSAMRETPPAPEESKAVGTIGGTIWTDANANGVQDEDEWGMSGVTVYLRNTTGERIAEAETYAHACEGLFIFSGVGPGNYTIEVVLPDGYGFTVSGMGTPGETASDVDRINGTSENITMTADLILETDLVVRNAGLVTPPAAGSLKNPTLLRER
jgi:hypothetical protein